MKDTQNADFSYNGIELWDNGAASPVPALPLLKRISQMNQEHFRIEAKPEGERRTDGTYHPKSFMFLHDDQMELLKENRLTFYVQGMSEMAYITVAPEEHMSSEKMYDDEVDTLIVMATCDISDPN